MQDAYDVLIIGSGPAAVHAALPLVEKGLHVAMIDGGRRTPSILEEPLPCDFEEMRRARADQYRWFLGEDLSGIPIRGLEGGLGGGMTSGNRSYVTGGTDALPLDRMNAQITQTLACGGLAAVWGGTCAYLSELELMAMGLPAGEMQKHYEAVTQIVGISSPEHREHALPALTPDHHAAAMLQKAKEKWLELDQIHARVSQPASAVLTRPQDGRSAERYRDMDYYSDDGRTVWRPQFLLETLMKRENFHYIGGCVVEHIEETDDDTVTFARALDMHGATRRFVAKRVVVAAGAIGSARILSKSVNLYDIPLPVIVKPHVFSACLDLSSLGKVGPRERTSLCQLLVTDATKTADGLNSGVAQMYGYRSLLLFRLLENIPLPAPEAMKLLSLLSPSLLVADIRFPASEESCNSLMLQRTNGHLRITLDETSVEHAARKQSLKRMHKALRMLGVYPAKTLWLPHGSTSHYAGTIPMDDEGKRPLSTDRNGKLHQAKSIYVADASTFRKLAPEPHTLTIMANARRIGQCVEQSL